jgi:signal transduction histidine kinase
MTQPAANISAQRVKLSVYQLNCLTAHPACVARCVGCLSPGGSYEDIPLFPESDPAIAFAIISLCRQKDISVDLKNLDFPALLSRLSKADLLKTILALKVYNTEDTDFLSLIASFIRRNGTRAFAARLIAQKAGLSGTSEAFTAALFADTGLFALAQLFTKSLLMLCQEAKERKVSLASLEKEHLGITDNIISRLLLEKWQFGPLVADTAWLYKTSAGTLTDKLPNAGIIGIVRLADMLCDSEHQDDFQSLIQRLSLTDSDINEIKEKTQAFAGQISELFGLEIENPQQFYSETIKQIYLNQLTALRSEDIFSQFMQKFTAVLNPQFSPIGIAETSAKIISECFLAQSICVFTTDPCQADVLLASVIDGCSVRSLLINCPKGFSISQAAAEDLQPWLYEQIGIESEKSCFVPIKCDRQTIAGIILCGPMPDENLFEQITDVLGKVFALSGRSEREKSIAQLAVDCLAQSKPQAPAVQQALPKDALAQTAAELAAGAAHELNNPLAVISGRAQLLVQSETDETKKLILNQIIEKTRDIHEITGQLMSYARPARPEIRTVSPFVVINNCLEKANARYLSEPPDINLENIESLSDIEVDAEQVAEAIAQIIYNALESYESGNGPVQITGSQQPQSGLVEICIKDQGCGMSNETLQKAIQPFFSDKPAGRQRGMGLSLAASFLKNNGCTLKIESQLDKGTTVTINLPRADKSDLSNKSENS